MQDSIVDETPFVEDDIPDYSVTEDNNTIEETNDDTTSSSKDNLNFLEKEEYQKLNIPTKNNIRKIMPNMDEDKFKKYYNLTKIEFGKGFCNDFNAVLYKGLQGDWNYKCVPIHSESLTPEKKDWLRTFTGLRNDPILYQFVKKSILLIPMNILKENRTKLGRMNGSEFKKHLISLIHI